MAFKILQVVVVAAIVASVPLQDEWTTFKTKYNKQYSQQEEHKRMLIYEHNLKMIEVHNAEAQNGKHTYTLSVNQFVDLTHEEFVQIMSGFRGEDSGLDISPVHRAPVSDNLPASVDWRKEGYVTPVKNQLIGMGCGSDYAFSATGSLEGQHFKYSGQLVSLSEQNIVDCSQPQGNAGCRGGLMNNAFQYIAVNNGIDTESSYPYVGMESKCKFNPANVGATDQGFVNVESRSESALKDAVATVGPIAVAIDASKPSFQFYEKGVYNDSSCSSTNVDHPVLAVGYGNLNNMDYWLVKNSWGSNWGMSGYILMARNFNNMCGIASNASYPIVPKLLKKLYKL